MPRSHITTLRRPPLVLLGLAGGIASGKSTVAGMFADQGATVLHADEVGRAVVEPGEPALAEIVAEFGSDYLLPDGTLDRRKLGRRVFEEPATLSQVTRTHASGVRNEAGRTVTEPTDYGSGVLTVRRVLLGRAKAGERLRLAWRNPTWLACPRVEWAWAANQPKIWLLQRGSNWTVTANYPGRALPLTERRNVIRLIRDRPQNTRPR